MGAWWCVFEGVCLDVDEKRLRMWGRRDIVVVVVVVVASVVNDVVLYICICVERVSQRKTNGNLCKTTQTISLLASVYSIHLLGPSLASNSNKSVYTAE